MLYACVMRAGWVVNFLKRESRPEREGCSVCKYVCHDGRDTLALESEMLHKMALCFPMACNGCKAHLLD